MIVSPRDQEFPAPRNHRSRLTFVLDYPPRCFSCGRGNHRRVVFKSCCVHQEFLKSFHRLHPSGNILQRWRLKPPCDGLDRGSPSLIPNMVCGRGTVSRRKVRSRAPGAPYSSRVPVSHSGTLFTPGVFAMATVGHSTHAGLGFVVGTATRAARLSTRRHWNKRH